MRNFNFANLVGAKPQAAETSEAMDDDEKHEAEDGPTDEDEQDEAAKDDESEEPEAGADEPEDEASAAFKRGVAKGRRAERERCAAIFAHAGPATIRMAANLAFNTGVSPAEAKSILDSAPRGASRLDALMAGKNPAPIATPSAGGDDDLPPELRAAQAAAMKKDR